MQLDLKKFELPAVHRKPWKEDFKPAVFHLVSKLNNPWDLVIYNNAAIQSIADGVFIEKPRLSFRTDGCTQMVRTLPTRVTKKLSKQNPA